MPRRTKRSKAARANLQSQFREDTNGQFASKKDEETILNLLAEMSCTVEDRLFDDPGVSPAELMARGGSDDDRLHVMSEADCVQYDEELESAGDPMGDLTDLSGDIDDEEEIIDLDRLEQVSQEVRDFVTKFKQAPPTSVFTAFSTSGRLVEFPNRSARDRYVSGQKATKTAGQRPGQMSMEAFMRPEDPDTDDEMLNAAVHEQNSSAGTVGNLYSTPEEAVEALIPFADLNGNARKDQQWAKDGYQIYHKFQARALLKYFQLIIQKKVGKMEASAQAAEALYNKVGQDSHKAKSIRVWVTSFLQTGKLVHHRQGKHVKTFTIISDEHVQVKLKAHLREMADNKRYPKNFMDDLNSKLLRTIDRAPAQVCEKTALRWMSILGFHLTNATKGWFTDGHERPDVVESRTEFIATMVPLMERMCWFEDGPAGPLTVKRLPPAVENGTVREFVMLTQDEMTIYCGEGNKHFYMENGKKKLLPKTKGQSMMVAGVVCPCHGFMKGEVDGVLVQSYRIFYAGTNREGWYTNEDIVADNKRCEKLYKQLHPNCDIGQFYDHSMTHCARAPDGLDAGKLNLTDGGKNVPMLRDGWYMKDGERVVQKMQHNDAEGKPVQKGLRTILEERGKDKNDGGHQLVKLCHPCKNHTPHDQRGSTETKCCAWYVLSQEPDFLAQRPWLQEEVEEMGFSIHFYPKYHCELNFIEMLWGWIKSYHRRHCTYSFKDLDSKDGLRKTIDERLPLLFVRKAARHAFRFIDGYRKGFTGAMLDYAVKKFKGHRAIPASSEQLIKNEFEARIVNKAKKVNR